MNIRKLLLDCAKATGSFLLVMIGGTLIALVSAHAIGYLPYSDRPGPGWGEASFSVEEISFFVSWAVLLVAPGVFIGIILFTVARLLRTLHSPLLLIRIFCGVTAALVSFILVAGVGWYIAIASFPVWVAAGLGLFWGSSLLPRYVNQELLKRPSKLQWSGIGVVMAVIPLLTYWQYLAPRQSQSTEVMVIRAVPNDGELLTQSWKNSLTDTEQAILTSEFPQGELHSGTSGSQSSDADAAKARILIVVTAPLTREATFQIPRATSVVYIQRGDRWIMHPPTAPSVGKAIRLGPAVGGGTFQWPDQESPSSFTWYPPIPGAG